MTLLVFLDRQESSVRNARVRRLILGAICLGSTRCSWFISDLRLFHFDSQQRLPLASFVAGGGPLSLFPRFVCFLSCWGLLILKTWIWQLKFSLDSWKLRLPFVFVIEPSSTWLAREPLLIGSYLAVCHQLSPPPFRSRFSWGESRCF